uniref:Uncharacterized protein n=1 Tax=Florenciella parvula TaxID=236787 RepID=A0A7S2G440_9STRA
MIEGVNFLTGAGGFLQTVLYGFPGLRFDEDLLRLANPTLIEGSSHMKVRGLAYRGARFDIAFGTEVAAKSGTNAELSVTLSSRSPGGSGFVVSNEETGEAVALAAEGDSASFDFAPDASAYTIAEA